MVNGVNWNPFTNKALTADQIDYIDKTYGNSDGIAQEDEINKAREWLNGQDDEGRLADDTDDVTNVDGKELWNKAKSTGQALNIKMDNVTTDGQMDAALDIIIDQYIETLTKSLANNSSISDSYKTKIKAMLEDPNIKQTFLAEKNIKTDETYKADGIYKMDKIAEDFAAYMDKKIEDMYDSGKINDVRIGQYTGIDNKFETMAGKIDNLTAPISITDWADTLDENGNSNPGLRTMALDYIMSLLLSAETTEKQQSEFNGFLNAMGVNGTDGNVYLQNAKKYCEYIKTGKGANGQELPPDEIRRYMDLATQAVLKFLNTQGKDKVFDAVQTTQVKKAKENATNSFNKVGDKWAESQIKANMSEDDKALMKAFVQTQIGKFVEACYGTGEYVPMEKYKNCATPEKAFEQFLNDQLTELNKIKDGLKAQYTDKLDDTTDENGKVVADGLQTILEKTTKNARENGSISDEEKADIVSAATDFVLAELLSDVQVVELLANLGVKEGEMIEINDLIKEIKTCTDPKELNELIDKVKTCISELLNQFSADELAHGVDTIKNVNASDDMKNKALANSSIYVDYQNGVSRCGGRGDTDDQGLRAEIENMARADMQTYADQLKAQLKKEFGNTIKDEEIDKLIKSAMNDTIAQFWGNYHDKGNQHGTYATDADDFAFTSARRSNSHKRRFSYNVKALIDRFTENFNKAAEQLQKEKRNPNNISYDKEDVLIESGYADEYGIGDTVIEEEDKKDLLNKAQTALTAIKASIKNSMMAKGINIPENKIDDILDDALASVLSDTEKFITGGTKEYSLNYATLINAYMDEVDKRIDEYRKSAKA